MNGIGRIALAAWLCTALLSLCSCAGRPVEVDEAGPGVILAEEYESYVRGGTLSPSTRRVLAYLGFDPSDLSQDATDAIFDFIRFAPDTNDSSTDLFRIALAELLILECERMSKQDPDDDRIAPTYLLAAWHAHDYVRNAATGPGLFDSQARLALDLYNAAVGGFVAGYATDLVSGQTDFYIDVPLVGPVAVSVLHDRPDTWDPKRFQRFIRADRMEIEGLRNRHLVAGVGAPMVAQRDPTPELLESFPHLPPEVISYPVGVVMDFPGPVRLKGATSDSLERIEFRFYDPFRTDSAEIWGSRVRLSSDFTAAMAGLLSRTNIDQLGRRAMLTPKVLQDRTRVYRLEPYNEDKIPLLLVHGLRSSPVTWRELVNELRSDPVFRERYQIWQFVYPTGLPIPRTAWLLRTSLKDIKNRLDPQGTAPWRGKMVVVGHSMGGVISRTLVQDIGDRLWYAGHTSPIEDFVLSESVREHLEQVFFYEHDPDVARVIFAAAPFRGASLAESWFGKIGRNLTSTTSDLRDVIREYITHNSDKLVPWLRDAPENALTGIGSLSPENPLLAAYNETPINEGVAFHVLIGDEGNGESDGVVPHESSRLEGAISELVVPSGHNVHESQQGIAEIWRILRLHLRTIDADRPEG